MKLALSATLSILDVKSSLKLADVLTVSIKNTALRINDMKPGTGKKHCGLPVFYLYIKEKLIF